MNYNRGRRASRGTGQTFDSGEGRIFPCESCGADLEFHIGEQSLKCPYCGHVKQIEHDPETVLAEQTRGHAGKNPAVARRREGAGEQDDPRGRHEAITGSCDANPAAECGILRNVTSTICRSVRRLSSWKGAQVRGTSNSVDGVLPFQLTKTGRKTTCVNGFNHAGSHQIISEQWSRGGFNACTFPTTRLIP